MIFYDTQIISFAFNNSRDYVVTGGYIPSIVANEFLLVYKKGEASSANYYLPNMLNKHNKIGVIPLSNLNMKKLAYRKKNTDRIVLDFGNDFDKYIEFGSYSMTKVINEKNNEVFNQAIKHLPKDRQKLLKGKFKFLIDNNIKCIALNTSILDIAFEFIYEFTKKHNFKKDKRNSINDLLILSSAIENKAKLVSDDNELNRFACDMANGTVTKNGDFVNYDFSCVKKVKKINSRESKGYVNRGWQFKILNRNT